ncbi:hypothetical protein HPB50_011452 [Hyalomma asiaticum]|uniref:Uncharacterized protein n=1 Tax=Hyalomma asiaticum TaxID=266040 RepID=A0ACB7SMU3_HYAAI|nr:hypothetical protein HPB50_011452 [Hyalomma asiaticum]
MAELSDPLVFSRDNAYAYDQRSLTLSRRPERRRSAHVEKTHTKGDIKADAKTRISGTDISRESSKSAGAQMRSAQAHSFWSMYSPVAVQVKPTRYFTVADLACAVATILATAVTILSLVVVFANQPPGRGQQVIVSGRFGNVQGIGLKVLGHTDVYAFLGVPYARPPVGKLRFRRTYSDKLHDPPGSQMFPLAIEVLEVKLKQVLTETILL